MGHAQIKLSTTGIYSGRGTIPAVGFPSFTWRLGRSSLVLMLLWVGLPGMAARAQQADLSTDFVTAPEAVLGLPASARPAPAWIVKIQPPPLSLPHPFWDRTNRLLFFGIAMTRGLDYSSTRNFQARGRQEILLPDAVVNNSAGFTGLETAATVSSIGISYLFHRTGHHKLERWMSIGHICVTGFGDARNYALESRHPR